MNADKTPESRIAAALPEDDPCERIDPHPDRLTIGDFARLLWFDRRAILKLASSRSTLWIGAILVLTASIARNYDGAYVPAEWHVLLHGYGASVVNALLFFAAAHLIRKREDAGRGPSFWCGYIVFLSLFWATAPMAWLYAIPYERIFPPLGAVEMNLWTLALVSVWRVALLTRIASVLFAAPFAAVLFVYLLLADLLVVAAMAVIAEFNLVPLVAFMGGLRRPPEIDFIAGWSFTARILSFVAIPVFALGALIAAGVGRRGTTAAVRRIALPPARPVIVLIGAALGIGVLILVVCQPEQRRTFIAERMLDDEEFSAAFAYMSRFERRDFPPVWDPPPREVIASRDVEARMREAIEQGEYAPWVVELWCNKGLGILIDQTDYEFSFTYYSAIRPKGIEARREDLFERLDEETASAVLFYAARDPKLAEDARACAAAEIERWRQWKAEQAAGEGEATQDDETPADPP